MRTLIFCCFSLIIGLCCIWYPVINGAGAYVSKTCEYVDPQTCLIRDKDSPAIKSADISHLKDQSFQIKEQVVYDVDTPTDKALRASGALLLILLIILLIRFSFYALAEGASLFFLFD